VTLEAIGVSLSYGTAVSALHRVNLRIGPGEVAGIVGPEGCGKSSLLRLFLNGHPSSGVCLVDGRPAPPRDECAVHYVSGVGYAAAVGCTPGCRADLVLDEPPVHAVGEEAGKWLALIRARAACGRSVLVATRSLRHAALCADRVAILVGGRVRALLDRGDLEADALDAVSWVHFGRTLQDPDCPRCRAESGSAR
jgi:ABC-type multidrug transport system ATPase subunit